jgi:RNA polymerase sigma-70 factor (ECF subfamily)
VPHDDPQVDVQLARRIIAGAAGVPGDGDATAEAELCRRLLPRIRAWGLRHVRDEAAALDLGQQVMIVVLEALRAGKVDNVERIAGFVFGTCKLTLAAWRRGERRRSELLERFPPDLAGGEANEYGLDRRRLASCLDHLPPRARTLLALAFFAECSTDEIARQLGTSTGNVRVLRHRALEQLHACMEGT